LALEQDVLPETPAAVVEEEAAEPPRATGSLVVCDVDGSKARVDDKDEHDRHESEPVSLRDVAA